MEDDFDEFDMDDEFMDEIDIDAIQEAEQAYFTAKNATALNSSSGAPKSTRGVSGLNSSSDAPKTTRGFPPVLHKHQNSRINGYAVAEREEKLQDALLKMVLKCDPVGKDTWTCQKCTYINPRPMSPKFAKCVSCKTRAPWRPEPAPPSAWPIGYKKKSCSSSSLNKKKSSGQSINNQRLSPMRSHSELNNRQNMMSLGLAGTICSTNYNNNRIMNSNNNNNRMMNNNNNRMMNNNNNKTMNNNNNRTMNNNNNNNRMMNNNNNNNNNRMMNNNNNRMMNNNNNNNNNRMMNNNRTMNNTNNRTMNNNNNRTMNNNRMMNNNNNLQQQNIFQTKVKNYRRMQMPGPPLESPAIVIADRSTSLTFQYPNHYTVRQYQLAIVEAALLKNTLVMLPTGLGKTLIAAVLMLNFYRWFPEGKIIFMAPTKPLVEQQVEACHKVVGIPVADTAELMGKVKPNLRKAFWRDRRVFFCTPQTLANDLKKGVMEQPEKIVLVVVDEAHKATGNYAYTVAVRHIRSKTSHFRILALSATPGKDLEKVQEVMSVFIMHFIIAFKSIFFFQKMFCTQRYLFGVFLLFVFIIK